MKKITFALSLTLVSIVAGIGFVLMTNTHERELEKQKFAYEMELSEKDHQIRMGFQPYISSFVNGKPQTKEEHLQIVKWLSRMPKSNIMEVKATVTENLPLKVLCDEVIHYQDSLGISMN